MNHKIPFIDLKSLNHGDKGLVEVANQLKQNFPSIGFAYLINHPIPKFLIDKIFLESKRFHALPLNEKLKIKHNDCFRGYMPNKTSKMRVSTEGSASKSNFVDSFVMMFEADESHPDYKEGLYLAGDNQWPENLAGFKESLEEYRDAMVAFSVRLIKAFAIAFNLDKDALDPLFVDPTYFLRLQHYPKNNGELLNDQFGIAPHTDAGFITILAQDKVGGLQVKFADGSWVDAGYVEDSFVLNAGAMMQWLTNDVFRAVPHRVISHFDKERFTIPFFFDSNMHATIRPLATCVSELNPEKYPPIVYGEYLMDRIQNNYKLGKRA